MRDHSILVIGCGSIGERHLRCFLKTGRTRVTGCDTNARLAARMIEIYGVETQPDWESALRSGRFTAAVVCTPAPWHVTMARTALEAGMHVLVEKPLAQSLEGVANLLAAHNSSDRQAAVAYVFHQFPALAGVRGFLARGGLGEVQQVVMSGGQPFHRLRPTYAETYYRDHRTGGGAIQDALTHSANWIESVIGPTDSVMCDCAHLVLPNVEVEDTVHVSARHGRVLTSYTLNQFQAPNETSFQFNSASGSVRAELHLQRWGWLKSGETAWTWQSTPSPDRDAHFIAQANAFIDQIEGRPSRLCSLEAALHTLRFNLAALASAEHGKRVACIDIQ